MPLQVEGQEQDSFRDVFIKLLRKKDICEYKLHIEDISLATNSAAIKIPSIDYGLSLKEFIQKYGQNIDISVHGDEFS